MNFNNLRNFYFICYFNDTVIVQDCISFRSIIFIKLKVFKAYKKQQFSLLRLDKICCQIAESLKTKYKQ
jgi:hypothetical protein